MKVHLACLPVLPVVLLIAACTGPASAPTTSENSQTTLPSAVKSDASGLPIEISHPQLYATPDGHTHFKEVPVPLTMVASPPPGQPTAQSSVQSATTIRHSAFQPKWGIYDRDHNIFHNPTSQRFVTVRTGELWVKASDGETRRFQAGDVFDVLDVAPSKGHITWVGDEPVVVLYSNFE